MSDSMLDETTNKRPHLTHSTDGTGPRTLRRRPRTVVGKQVSCKGLVDHTWSGHVLRLLCQPLSYILQGQEWLPLFTVLLASSRSPPPDPRVPPETTSLETRLQTESLPGLGSLLRRCPRFRNPRFFDTHKSSPYLRACYPRLVHSLCGSPLRPLLLPNRNSRSHSSPL